ncbi:hypothetical protein [Aquimarina sp. 2201CG5-10]|uniref:hypothetical protein n=1 Tax=Aquimarina callyspongiae TaxID=3098150 RepID=UPI002AB47C38|nr:hypothetical protein [Aquimarina sp. 2201CG5-10]MDY8136549.1 hypothetical protein [Aquimarina sp. 2201CG5-10]
MKRRILFLTFIFFTQYTFAQRNVSIKDSISIEADSFWGVDSFDAIFYSKDNVFYKKWNNQEWQYGDYILGQLSSVSILNPLKIMLFYESSNTIVLVDKYLTEIERINFNVITEFKNVTKASPANDNSIWIFDNNNQRLELFDTNSRKTLLSAQPINELPVALQSNFNVCWILINNQFLQYNVYGSLLYKFQNSGYSDLCIVNNDLILKKENNLFYYDTQSESLEKIKLPEITVKQFYVTNEILYIYHQTKIYSFDLTLQK